MDLIQLEQLCCLACQLTEETGDFIRQELGRVSDQQIEVKSLNSLVSYVDKTAEERLVAGLQKLLPGSVFLTEEATVAQQSGEYQWIIDPLDGTTNFLHQLPIFSVSVALRHFDETILGIVYEVNRQELFYAWQGSGAFMNGRPIHASNNSSLANAVMATGFPYREFELMKPYMVVLQAFMKKTRGLRRFGSAAVDLAYVACGRFDAFFEYGLSSWDVAAGEFIVRQAGGKVSDFRGGNDFLFGGEMLAAGNGVFFEVQEIVKAAFSKNL